MDRIIWFFGCLLAGLLGLVFTSPAFATVYPDNSAAYAACSSAAAARDKAKCVYRMQTPITGTLQGTYACVELIISSPTSSRVRYCGTTNGIHTCNGAGVQQSCVDAYENYVIPGTTLNTNSTQMYYWQNNVCASKPTFNADFPDGSIATGSLVNLSLIHI